MAKPAPGRWLRPLMRGALVLAGVLALWTSTESSREAGSLTIDLTLPGWFALVLLLYLGAGWYHRRRVRTHPAPATPAGESRPGPPTGDEPLIVRSGADTHLVDPARIRWVAAEGKYARLWLPERSILSQYSISEIDDQLEGRGFARTHRSRIVNLEAVTALRPRGSRDAEAVLDDGTRIPVSRSHRPRLERLLGVRPDGDAAG